MELCGVILAKISELRQNGGEFYNGWQINFT
jgi:hypothetical protein